MRLRPKENLRTEKSRHGRTCYYFRRGNGIRIRLPDDPNSPEFLAAYEAAKSGDPFSHLPTPTKFDGNRRRVGLALAEAFKGAKARSRQRGLEFDITEEWLLQKVAEQGVKCAATRIAFFGPHTAQSAKNPFSPSLDRINPRGGYTKDNIRIVVFALNMMLADWGDAIFSRVASAYKFHKSREVRPDFGGQSRRTLEIINKIKPIQEDFSEMVGEVGVQSQLETGPCGKVRRKTAV